MTSVLSKQKIRRVLNSWRAKGCSVAFVQQGQDGTWNGTIECAGVRDKQGAEVTEFVSMQSRWFTNTPKYTQLIQGRRDS